MSENISRAEVRSENRAAVANFPRIAEAIEKVSGSLNGNSVTRASVEFYRAALSGAGVDPDSLSFDETIEVSRLLYGISDEYRATVRETEREKREKVAAEASKKRDAAKRERAVAEKVRLEKLLANLAKS